MRLAVEVASIAPVHADCGLLAALIERCDLVEQHALVADDAARR
jgi:hypothetical protein